MEKVFEKIKTFLDSEAGLKISKNDTNEKCVVDNRFDLIKKCIDSTENKDDDFYSNLIELISIYIDKTIKEYESDIAGFGRIAKMKFLTWINSKRKNRKTKQTKHLPEKVSCC